MLKRTAPFHRHHRVHPVFIILLAVVPLAAEDPPEQHAHTNNLINSASPYLLQHAHNPVNWYPWGAEAFERAAKEDKPIFLSIGYAACHWCHVMEHESFENDAVAKVLNDNFISIKVDREERPDIDEVYMAATQAATGRGGWPMSVFMTPDRMPFLCGTYFPPNDRGGRRGFRGMCLDIANKWKSDRDTLLADAQSLVTRVRATKRTVAGKSIPDHGTISDNIDKLAGRFDANLGGFRSSRNKFPPTFAMELMLREHATQQEMSKPALVEAVENTLDHMARGGIYDHIGGGICRYSVDPRWFAPHFEKMLYDQGRVAGVYLSAYQLTQDEFYARTARGILDYCLADLRDAAGGFYSSRDADSEGEEGKFYVWTKAEIDNLLPPTDAALFNEYYNVKPGGNWHHGQNILFVSESDDVFAGRHEMSDVEWRKRLAGMRRIVFDAREKRIHPGLDDKILTEWNGLLITQLARAHRIFGEPRYGEAAAGAADFILREMVRDGRLFRAHRRGVTHIQANAADYANLIEALITLYETSFEPKWLTAAEQMNDAMIKNFHDSAAGGFFYTAHDAEELLVRSKNVRDSVVPSANSTAVHNLLRLAVHLHRADLRALAERTMRAMGRTLERGGLHRMQWGVLFYHVPPKEIAIVGDPNDPATQALIATVYRDYLPNKVVALATPQSAAAANAPPLLKNKKLVNNKPAAYVCQDYLCKRPTTKPDELAQQLIE